LDLDQAGEPVVRGEILALAPSAESLAIAMTAGFVVTGREHLPVLGLEVVTLAAPAGLSTVKAVRRLRTLDPAGQYDFDHIYDQSGNTPLAAAKTDFQPATGARVDVGMIDGGVAALPTAFAGVRLTQRGFALGDGVASEHGTEVASVLVSQAPVARLFVADVYGRSPSGGSAADIARGLEWLARDRVGVINISLAGPPNLLLAAATRAASDKGILIVAPVGNDGPAAPPQYPASYPEVIAVTAVDARGRLLPEAGRAAHVDFAALGAGVRVAKASGGFGQARGTSFAAPIVSARLAVLSPVPDPRRAAEAVEALESRARKGPGALGHGVVDEIAPGGR
jgi:subtilisin family serine protease